MVTDNLLLTSRNAAQLPVISGQTGLGKSTMVNTLFASHLIDSKGRLEVDEPIRQTTEIQETQKSEPHTHSNFDPSQSCLTRLAFDLFSDT